ncbi:hypothetical protein NE237_002458 [Protea cynaroides]|uniref:Uncharacterized protein n=1 Tax=Protea cynaroides TaxID=273540 RepID=A0A9Q0QZD0_9MAGN|nr:hypothetical protein NE237_002458 [Protea cynaroides]
MIGKTNRTGDKLNIIPIQNEFILYFLRANNGLTFKHIHLPHLILTKEVTNLDALVVVRDAGIDRDVSIYKPHPIAVALGDILYEVLDMANLIAVRLFIFAPRQVPSTPFTHFKKSVGRLGEKAMFAKGELISNQLIREL